MAHDILNLNNIHPVEGYSHVAKVGNTLYIAGQISKNLKGELVGRGDFEAQARQVFTNLKNIIEETGGEIKNIVKMTTFLTHFDFIDTFRKVRGEFLFNYCPPNTLLIVNSLALAEYMIEIEAIAVLD